MKTLAG